MPLFGSSDGQLGCHNETLGCRVGVGKRPSGQDGLRPTSTDGLRPTSTAASHSNCGWAEWSFDAGWTETNQHGWTETNQHGWTETDRVQELAQAAVGQAAWFVNRFQPVGALRCPALSLYFNVPLRRSHVSAFTTNAALGQFDNVHGRCAR